jgi:Transposase DDE domain
MMFATAGWSQAPPVLAVRSGLPPRHRPSRLALSEGMTILVWFHASHDCPFPHDCLDSVLPGKRAEFPALPSDTRFVERIRLAGRPRCADRPTHPGSRGWFEGFQLPLVIHDQGERLAFCLTPGKVDDRRPGKKLVRQRGGKRGDSSQEWFEPLGAEGLQLITKIRRHRKNQWMPLFDKILLRQRARIECVHEQWKPISQIEHTRHRSPSNGIVCMIAALLAYTFQPKQPALGLFTTEGSQVP